MAISDQRNAKGQFVKGNSGGPGNPFARQVGVLREAMISRVSPEKFGRIVDALVQEAEQGDLRATKEILDRTLGKPIHADLLERIEQLEEAIENLKAEGDGR